MSIHAPAAFRFGSIHVAAAFPFHSIQDCGCARDHHTHVYLDLLAIFSGCRGWQIVAVVEDEESRVSVVESRILD